MKPSEPAPFAFGAPVPVALGEGVEPDAAAEPTAAPVPEGGAAPAEEPVPVVPVVVLPAAAGEPFTEVEAAALVLKASNDFSAVGFTAKTMPF